MLKRTLAPLALAATSACAVGSLPAEKRSMRTELVVVDAPSNLGLRPPSAGVIPGVYRMPDALRAAGLVARLRATDGGRVSPPAYSPDPDLETGYRNGPGLRTYSVALAERTGELVRAGKFALVLGGDCSVLLGNTLALKRLGRYGLVFIDGHDDFSPARDLSRYRGIITAAGTDLALATGHGPDALTDLLGQKPYVREEDAVIFGMSRDPADQETHDVAVLETTAIRVYPIGTVREMGARKAAEEALRVIEGQRLDGFWIHVDADVLDRSVMPAVDSPNPLGLRHDELAEALGVFLASPGAVGLELTIYDPDLDPQGIYGRELADTVVKAFAAAGRS